MQSSQPATTCYNAPHHTESILTVETLRLIAITDRPIPLDQLLSQVTTPICGAQVLFVGTTRQWTGAIETTQLEYDCYQEMALKMLQSLESEARERWTIAEVAIVHRLGVVAVGEASVAVAVGAAHRDAAFTAARWIIDEIKTRVPIWKREQGHGTESHWVHPR